MDPIFVTSAALGAGIAWAVCKFFYDQRRRNYLRDTTDRIKTSGEIQDRRYAATTMAYRSALELVERGDLDGAKRELSSAIAIYYHIHKRRCGDLTSRGPKPESDWTGRELEAIERDAKRFASLRAALEQKSNQPAA